MDVQTSLQHLGLTEYEAKAYAALLGAPGVTGYEVARHSGVPRGRIYEVMAGLVAKGAAHSVEEGDRTLYYPVPHGELLRRHVNRAEQLAADLAPLLNDLARPGVEAPLVTLKGHQAILERGAELAAIARNRLFVSGWPEDLERLAPALRAAEARGVMVFALHYGAVALGLARQYYHQPPVLENRAPGAALPALVAVADHAEALMAATGPAPLGFWTRNPGVVLMAAELVRHDIFLAEAANRMEPALLQQFQRMTADLQAMWFDLPPTKEE